jgi:pimeloyl-ACP methyl ester carboxylesterase
MNQDAPDKPQSKSRTVRLSRGPIHLREEGTGPAIIMIHGLPGTGRDFRYLSPPLAEAGYWAIAPDMPSFGLTPLATCPEAQRSHQVQLIADLATALGLQSFHLMGHSFGGSLAMCAAAALPGRVRGLVLVNSIGRKRHHILPPVPKRAFGLVARAMKTPLLGTALIQSTRRLYKKMGFPHHFDAEDLAYQTRLMRHLSFTQHKEALANLRCPTLVVSSEDDPFIERDVSFDLSASLPDDIRHCHLHYQEGGHYLQKHRASEITVQIEAMFRTK